MNTILSLLLASALSGAVVVEEVPRGSGAEAAGLRAGDVILSWSREARPRARRGAVLSALDLIAIEVEEAPRGAVKLEGRRASQKQVWTLGAVPWGLKVQPVTEADKLTASARALAEAKKWPEADEAYERAVSAASPRQPTAAAYLLREWAGPLRRRSEFPRAEAAYRRAIELDRKASPESVGQIWSEAALCALARERGDLEQALAQGERALQMAKKLVPGSLVEARCLGDLGAVLQLRSDFARSSEVFTRALALWEAQAPGSVLHGEGVANLAVLSIDQVDLVRSEELHRRALAIFASADPKSRHIPRLHSNLGIVFAERGDLAAADEQWRTAIAKFKEIGEEGIPMARVMANLGAVAINRGDLAAAEGYNRQALAVFEKVAPKSFEIPTIYSNLSVMAKDRGDLAEAEALAQRALDAHEKLGPESIPMSEALHNLGAIAVARGNLAGAEAHFKRGLAIEEKLVPGGVDHAFTLYALGELARERGDLAGAREWHTKGLAIRQKMSAGTTQEAESRHALGLIHRRQGDGARAAELFCGAVDSLERQKAKLGGSQEAKAAFATKHAGYYHACAGALHDLGRDPEAFHVVERGRARLLLAMLAERELEVVEDLPAELAQERARVDGEYERLQGSLAGLHPSEAKEEVDRTLVQLASLREAREAVIARIQKASPRFAALHYPQPLDLAGAVQALDAGTALLSYSVGEDRTLLLVVRPEAALAVVALPVGEKALRERVDAWLGLIARRLPAEEAEAARQASELYDLLVRPAEPHLGRSERLLISPDGPLQTLPFAALLRAGRRLVEWKPLHVAVSATVFAELKKGRREATGPGLLVAFGDPHYPRGESGPALAPDAVLRDAGARGWSLAPLPAARAEVEAIVALDPQSTRAFLGEEATEERAKGVGREARYVHFACHGFLDERSPLSSALALSIPPDSAPGRENGFLQVWEIFERVRIDAELVTLSACKTALGKESAGEGLLGLTRAFQYAGARSVLASLWSVSDRSTAELMKSFYTHLRAGHTKDQSLRAAQMALIRKGGRTAQPYHWAAFELSGDWR